MNCPLTFKIKVYFLFLYRRSSVPGVPSVQQHEQVGVLQHEQVGVLQHEQVGVLQYEQVGVLQRNEPTNRIPDVIRYVLIWACTVGGHTTFRILFFLRYVVDIGKSSPNPKFF